MKYTPEHLGWKVFGLYYFSKNNMFHRSFVILSDAKSEKDIIDWNEK